MNRIPPRKMHTSMRLAKARRRRMYFRIVIVSAFFLSFSCIFILNSEPFRVKIIEISGVSRTSAEEIFQKSAITVGDNLFTMPVGEIRGRIMDRQPLVRKADIVRVLPSKVRIQIYERQPFAYVSDPDGKNILLIDTEKIVLEKPNGIADVDLFHVVSDGLQQVNVGDKLVFPHDEMFTRMCVVLGKALKGRYKKVMFNYSGIKLYLNDGTYVLLGDCLDADIEKKILLIPVIIEELKERKLPYAGLNLSVLAVPTYIKPQ